MRSVKEFFKSRSLGFYFLAAAVLLALIQLIIYSAAFSDPAFVKYKHWSVILFSVLAMCSGLGLCLTRKTEYFAPLAVFVFELLSFVMFVKYGYMYFSELFFAGVSAEAFAQMNYGYMGSIILYILCWGTSIASFFLRQRKKAQPVKEEATV